MARIARIKAEGESFYHVVSRIANKAFLLNNDACSTPGAAAKGDTRAKKGLSLR
jgi:hypothetical protein